MIQKKPGLGGGILTLTPTDKAPSTWDAVRNRLPTFHAATTRRITDDECLALAESYERVGQPAPNFWRVRTIRLKRWWNR